LSVTLGHSIPEYVVEPLAVGIIEGGTSFAHVAVFAVMPLVVTMNGVTAYVEVLPAPAMERVGKEQIAPLAKRVSDGHGLCIGVPTGSEASS
jgi:hypothetical protein